MKSIEERIQEAREDVAWARRAVTPRYEPARERAMLRAWKRLRDLEAVRDGKAVEVHSTMSVNFEGAFNSMGRSWVEPGLTVDPHEERETRDPGDRITILRAIAYLPANDETEAESEDA